MILKSLSSLRLGDYFRFPNRSKVYIFKGRKNGKFAYLALEDETEYFTGFNREVETNFKF